MTQQADEALVDVGAAADAGGEGILGEDLVGDGLGRTDGRSRCVQDFLAFASARPGPALWGSLARL